MTYSLILVRLARGVWLEGTTDWVVVVDGELTGCATLNQRCGWLFVCMLYFSAAGDPNAVRNLSMVTAQHLFLFKE